MEVILGKFSGFCAGVYNAVTKAYEIVEKEENVYSLGELVHNKQVVGKLEGQGMKTVEDIEEIPNGSNVIIRAHGVAKHVYERAKEKNLNIEDLTCVKVQKIHDKVLEKSKDAFIIVMGEKGHAETVGTQGFAGDYSYVVQDESDILDAYMKYEEKSVGEVFVVAQTTFSSTKFDELVKEIEDNFAEANVTFEKTICDATELRQKEAAEISKMVNKMVVIGGKNSANTVKLVEIAQKDVKDVYHIQTLDDLKDVSFSSDDKVGLLAGASTPREIINEVKEYLEKI